jgi:hypothetical protein
MINGKVCVYCKLSQRSLCRVLAGGMQDQAREQSQTINYKPLTRSTLCKERIFYQCFAAFVKCVANFGALILPVATRARP